MKYFFILLLIPVFAAASACRNLQPLSAEKFDYEKLSYTFYLNNPGGHLPLTIHEGRSASPFIYKNRFLFYSSDRDGGKDIWMRDLTNTVTTSIISHPSDQHSPGVSQDGKYLVYISENRDVDGDLFLVKLVSRPDKIINQILSGSDTLNYWSSSVNLSEKIEKLFSSSENPACRGRSSERNPIFSPDGSIYFLSSRCSQEKDLIWRIRVKGNKIKGMPEKLSADGASQLSMSPDGKFLAYLSYDVNPSGEIKILDLSNGRSETADISRSQNDLLLFPVISGKKRLYYARIFRDTNSDGEIRPDDNASIFAVDLNSQRRRVSLLLEDFSPIRGLHLSDFIGGSLVYSADRYGSSNLYLLKTGGIIPVHKSIQEQYEFAKLLKNENPRRYYMALDSVREYFSNSAEARIYEGLTVPEIWKTSFKIDDAGIIHEIKTYVASTLKTNPYAALMFGIEIGRKNRRQSLQSFISSTNGTKDINIRILRARAMHDLADLEFKSKRFAECRNLTSLVQTKFPGYPDIRNVILLEARSELSLRQITTDEFHKAASSLSAFPEGGELENAVFLFYTKMQNQNLALSLIERSLQNKGPQEILFSLRTARSQILFDRYGVQESRSSLMKFIHQIPDRSPVYIRAWKLASLIFEQENNIQAANDAKIRYGSRYTKYSGVDLNKNDFIKIIKTTRESIESSLNSARNISAKIEASGRSALFLPLELIPVKPTEIQLNITERNELIEFCKEGSPSGSLMMLLGKKEFVQQYVQFCAKNKTLLQSGRKGIPVSEAKNAADLLYLTSYVRANMINLLFLNLNKNSLFQDLQKEESIAYHRLKIDIAREHNDRLIAWENSLLKILKPENIIHLITEKDPFDSSIFDDLIHGYRLASDEAKYYHDTAVLYGHAYTLLQKSIAREKFYDSIQSGSLYIPNATLMEKKELTLQNLKNAEYQLQYILYTNPENFEAYILLSWLYQYIDERRSTFVERPVYFIEKVINYLTKTRSARLTDGVFYAQIYKNYFPDRLYEENVDLLQSALQFSHDATLHERAALHLNLANNYFNLLNFTRAEEHYGVFQNILKNYNIKFFDSHTQEALFYYHSGRSFFQNGKYEFAASAYDNAISIYRENEYRKYRSEYEKLPEQSLFNPLNYVIKDEKQNAAKENFNSVRYKMAVLFALKGISFSENGEHENAIENYKSAKDLLYEEFPPPDKKVSKSGLLNYIALSYQKLNDKTRSDDFASAAEAASLKTGLRRDDEKYQPQTVAGRLLGFLIGYGEDFSVIGDGRTPYGLSSLRQHELALGIQLENMLVSGNYRDAENIIEKRFSVFDRKDGDVLLGRLGVISSIHNRAWIHQISGSHLLAAEDFSAAAEYARKNGLHDKYILNMQNYFHSLFAHFDSGHPDQNNFGELINSAEENFRKFKNEYFNRIKQEYIEQKVIEDPDFSYSSGKDDPVVKNILSKKMSSLGTLEAGIYYYRGIYTDKFAADENAVFQSREYLRRAGNLYAEAADRMEEDQHQTHHLIHTRLNYAKAMQQYGNIPAAIEGFILASETAYEFNILSDYWFARYGLFSALMDFSGMRKPASFRSTLPDMNSLIRELSDLLDQNPEIHGHLGSHPLDFFKEAADFMIEKGNSNGALFYIQKSWRWRMQKAVIQFPIRYRTESESGDFEEAAKSYAALNKLHEQEIALGIKRRQFKELVEKKIALQNRYRNAVSRLAVHPVVRKYFTEQSGPQIPELWKKDALIRFSLFKNRASCWTYSGHNIVFKSTFVNDGETGLKNFTLECVPKNVTNTLFILPDDEMYRFPIDAWIREKFADSLNSIAFTSSETDTHSGFLSEIEQITDRVNHLHIFYSRDLEKYLFLFRKNKSISVEAVPPGAPFSITKANDDLMTEMFSGKKELPLVYLKSGPDRFFTEIALTYEILRMSGTGSLIVHHASAETLHKSLMEKGEGMPLDSGEYRIFGSTGYDSTGLKAYFLNRGYREKALGESGLKENRLENALLHFLQAELFLSRTGNKSATDDVSASIASINMALGNTEDAENRYRKLIENKNSYGIHIEYIKNLLTAGQIDRADKSRGELDGKYPERIALSDKILFPLAFSAQIKTASFKNYSDFLKSTERLLSQKSEISRTDRDAITETLLRHAFYDLAGEFSDENLNARIREDRYFTAFALEGNYPLETNRTDFPAVLKLLADSDKASDIIRDAMEKFQSRKFYFTDEIVKNIGEDHLRKIPVLVRMALYRIILESSSDHVNEENFNFLKKVIEIEAELGGSRRSAIMYLNAASYFLFRQEFEKSEILFNGYLGKRKFNFTYADYQENEKKTGYILNASLEIFRKNSLPDLNFFKMLNFKKNNEGSLYSSIQAVRKKQNSQTLQSFKDYLKDSSLQDIQLAHITLKKIAENRRNYRVMLNCAFVLEKLEAQIPAVYRNYSEEIQNQIPSGQVFTAISGTPGRIYRFQISPGGFSVKKILKSRTENLNFVYEYLSGRKTITDSPDLLLNASDALQNILREKKKFTVQYYWLEGIYKFIPLQPNANYPQIMTMNPSHLLGTSPVNLAGLFPVNFSVQIAGQKPQSPETEWQKRMNGMITLALGKTGNGTGPVYIQSDSFAEKKSGTWMYDPGMQMQLSRNDFRILSAKMQTIPEKLSGPGIFSVCRPELLSHAYFIKSYFDRTAAGSPVDRFRESWFELLGKDYTIAHLSAYRLITSSFLK